jgi:DNA-binding MarR family transcriptional regulator
MWTVPASDQPPPGPGVAFLLTQLGAHAAERFALVLGEHDLTPPLAGIMRLLRATPGLSQQQLADRLAVAPSRIVGYLDELEGRGWISRTRDSEDRRVNVLALTAQGRKAFTALAATARGHEAAITAGLTPAERTTLLGLLTKIADHQQLTPGVHPGYRHQAAT